MFNYFLWSSNLGFNKLTQTNLKSHPRTIHTTLNIKMHTMAVSEQESFEVQPIKSHYGFWAAISYIESTLNFGWDPPMEHSSKVCIYLTQWFLSRKCKKFGMFTHNVMTIAHMAYWRGELKLVSVCPIKAFHCHFWISVEKKNQSYFQVYADTNFA